MCTTHHILQTNENNMLNYATIFWISGEIWHIGISQNSRMNTITTIFSQVSCWHFGISQNSRILLLPQYTSFIVTNCIHFGILSVQNISEERFGPGSVFFHFIFFSHSCINIEGRLIGILRETIRLLHTEEKGLTSIYMGLLTKDWRI